MNALILLGLILLACGPSPSAIAPADHATLTALVVECRTLVRANCERVDGLPVDSCPTLIECDKRIDAWQQGAGGSNQ